jgi:hypothetical protein
LKVFFSEKFKKVDLLLCGELQALVIFVKKNRYICISKKKEKKSFLAPKKTGNYFEKAKFQVTW